MANTIDLSVQPKAVTIVNSTAKDVSIQFYRNSAVLVLKAGDTLVVRSESSAEEAYFLSLQSEGLTVTSAAIAAE